MLFSTTKFNHNNRKKCELWIRDKQNEKQKKKMAKSKYSIRFYVEYIYTLNAEIGMNLKMFHQTHICDTQLTVCISQNSNRGWKKM